MEMKDNKIIVTDENGKSVEMEIYFTFEKDEKKYVVYFDPSQEGEEIALYAAAYDDENLYPVESDEEWDMIDEVVAAFNEEQDNDDEDEESK